MYGCLYFIFFIFLQLFDVCATSSGKVLVTVLVRNAAHFLPDFLKLLSAQDFPRERLSLLFATDSNFDGTETFLQNWKEKQDDYFRINIAKAGIGKWIPEYQDNWKHSSLCDLKPHCWTKERLQYVGKLREVTLELARSMSYTYYFRLDSDVFLTEPSTISAFVRLLDRESQIGVAAPLLNVVGAPWESNFWSKISQKGWFEEHESYEKYVKYEEIGIFSVPLVHSAYMIDLRKPESRQLSYLPPTRKEVEEAKKKKQMLFPFLPATTFRNDEMMSFAWHVRSLGIQQVISNVELWGFTLSPLSSDITYAQQIDLFSKKSKAKTSNFFYGKSLTHFLARPQPGAAFLTSQLLPYYRKRKETGEKKKTRMELLSEAAGGFLPEKGIGIEGDKNFNHMDAYHRLCNDTNIDPIPRWLAPLEARICRIVSVGFPFLKEVGVELLSGQWMHPTQETNMKFAPPAFKSGGSRETFTENYTSKLLSSGPSIFFWHNFLEEDEAEHLLTLLAKAKDANLLQRGTAVNNKTGKEEIVSYRKTEVLFIGDDEDPIVKRLSQRIEQLTGLTMPSADNLQLGLYDGHGFYEPHYDHCRPREGKIPRQSKPKEKFLQEARRCFYEQGNRIATLLTYIEAPEQGGETVFTRLNLRVKPKRLSALFWFNTRLPAIFYPLQERTKSSLLLNKESVPGEDDFFVTDFRTRHAACPVIHGQKVVANKWIRRLGKGPGQLDDPKFWQHLYI